MTLKHFAYRVTKSRTTNAAKIRSNNAGRSATERGPPRNMVRIGSHGKTRMKSRRSSGDGSKEKENYEISSTGTNAPCFLDQTCVHSTTALLYSRTASRPSFVSLAFCFSFKMIRSNLDMFHLAIFNTGPASLGLGFGFSVFTAATRVRAAGVNPNSCSIRSKSFPSVA